MKIDRCGTSKGEAVNLAEADHVSGRWDAESKSVRLNIRDMPDLYSTTARYDFQVSLTPAEIASAVGVLAESGIASCPTEVRAALKSYVPELSKLLAHVTAVPPEPRIKRGK